MTPPSCVTPPWLADFGFPSKNPVTGETMLLLIEGNMPGRADAGKIWQTRFNKFLLAYGLRQLVTDRRVWVRYFDHS